MKNAIIKIAACFTVIIFAVSCQEKPTDSRELTIVENSSGADHHYIKVDIDDAVSYMKKSANYQFIISPADQNCSIEVSDVSISQTTPNQGPDLAKEDFELTETIKDGVIIDISISLTKTGIDKLTEAKVEKTKEIVYKASLTFNSNGVTKIQQIDISIMPIKIVTKAEVEALIRKIGTVSVDANIQGTKATFDFSTFTLSTTAYEITAQENPNNDSYTCKASDAGNAIKTGLITALNNNTLGLKVQNNYYFDDKGFTEKNLVIIYILDIDPKYALDDSAAFITETYENGGGIKIKLTLQKYQWSRNNN